MEKSTRIGAYLLECSSEHNVANGFSSGNLIKVPSGSTSIVFQDLKLGRMVPIRNELDKQCDIKVTEATKFYIKFVCDEFEISTLSFRLTPGSNKRDPIERKASLKRKIIER